MYIRVLEVVSQLTDAVMLAFSPLFSLFFLSIFNFGYFCYFVFNFFDFFPVISNLLLIPPSVFFISDIILFILCSVWLFFCIFHVSASHDQSFLLFFEHVDYSYSSYFNGLVYQFRYLCQF